MRKWSLLLILPLAAQARDPAIARDFKAHNLCPSTVTYTQHCPGYIVDHKWPLCAGGPDEVANLQWQTVEDAKAKDKVEWKVCRTLRRLGYKVEAQ